jgi:hypothetical protein
MEWRKSTYSSNGGQACIEVASADGVMVRDTTNRDGGTLTFTTQAWATFTSYLK